MADIQTEIEKISSAVYGEEVRGAMVNSLTKINTAQESISKDVGSKQSTTNMYSTKQNLTDKESSYPSIKYLENYYYDMDDVDTELALKADTIKLLPACEGKMTFAKFSNFVLGQIGTSGTYNPDIKYRVISEDIMKFEYDLIVSVDDGFTAYVVKYAGGTYESIKSLSDTNGYVIPANTEFRLHIRKNTIEAIENPIDRPTADINEFVNAVKFQTKLAAEVADVDERVKSIESEIQNKDSYDIPDYYYADNYITDKINEIKQNCNILNGITFAFVTDMHFKVNQKQSKKLLKKIMDETNIPFVIFGGDAIYLYGTEEELNEQVAEFNSFKSYVGKNNLFCTRGNHDLYNREPENLFNFSEWVDALQAYSKPIYNGTLVSVDKNNETLTFSSTGGDCYTIYGANIFKIPVKPSTSYSLSFKQEGAQG